MLYNLLFDHGFALKHVTRTPYTRTDTAAVLVPLLLLLLAFVISVRYTLIEHLHRRRLQQR